MDLSLSGVWQVVPNKMIDNLLHICFRGTFEKLEVAVRVCVGLCFFHVFWPPVIVSCDGPWQNLVDEGYAATQILSQLHESIIEKDFGDKQKSAIAEKMAVSNGGGCV